MKLPQDLQHFSHATLVVVGDHLMAKFYLAGGDELEELDGVVVPKDKFSDNENVFANDVDDTSRLTHYVKTVATHIETLIAQQSITAIDLVLPTEVLRKVSEHLNQEQRGKIKRTLELDLVKEPILDVIRRLAALPAAI